MVRVISQETYNEVVKENMEDLNMEREEAIADAIAQFEAQGVDLSNIIKDLAIGEDEDNTIVDALRNLEALRIAVDTNESESIRYLKIIASECEKDMAHRLYAGKSHAYTILTDYVETFLSIDSIFIASLEALCSLMNGQPDLLDEKGVHLMILNLKQCTEPSVKYYTLRWINVSCVRHEMNRQKIFNSDVLKYLKLLLPKSNKRTLREALLVLRSLVLDDDVRVEFGQSHEHAKIIASDTLCAIIDLLPKYRTDIDVVSDLMITIAALLVRTEFCKIVEDSGGLIFILGSLQEFFENDKLVRQCFKLLKALAGNDEVKASIIQKGGAMSISTGIDFHKKRENVAIAGLACVSALTLRSPENSKALFLAHMPETIIQCMEIHSEIAAVQKMGSWSIRNMVSRSREQNEAFLKLGAENLLNKALQKFPECEYDIKAGLRDLGCDVNLREEWTGKGGKIHTDFKIVE